jgi:outer membrane receptor protein involved in Fe transport
VKSAFYLLSASVALLAAAPAAAQAPVTPYPSAFFAAKQPSTAFDMIERLPGFAFDGGDQGMRGYSGAAGNVLVDGQRPASKQEGLREILQRIPASSVERIELIRVGAPGIDMQGKALLANVVRKRMAETHGRVAASLSVFADARPTSAQEVQFARNWNDRLLEVSASSERERDDGKGAGPRLRVNAAGAPLRNAIYNEQEVDDVNKFALGFETPFAGGKLRLDGAANQEWTHADISEITTFPGPGAEFVAERERVREGEGAARFERKFGERWSVEVLALARRSNARAADRETDGADVTLSKRQSEAGESLARGALRWQGEALSLEFGGEGALNTLDSQSALVENGVAVFLPASDVSVEERRAEAFAIATWQIAPTLSLEAGGRAERSRLTQSGDSNLSKSLSYLKPRFAAIWGVDPQTQVRFESERRVGQLDFDDFVSSASLTSNTITAGNPDLEPDKTWRAGVAIERRLGKSSAITVTLQRDVISDVVDRIPIVGPGFAFDAPGNIGDGRRLEVSVNATLALDYIGISGGELKVDFTGRRSRVTDPLTKTERSISGEPETSGSIEFTQNLPGARIALGRGCRSGPQ